MRIEPYLPRSVRSRYALKLLGVSLVIVLLITAFVTVTAVQVSDRVQEDQLQSVERNAELEARALGQWIDGKQQVVRTLSSHEGLTPVSAERTRSTLVAERDALSPETETLSVVEHDLGGGLNGTTEPIVASTDRELVGEPLAATDINWKPTTGFAFDDTDDVVLSLVYTDEDGTLVAVASPLPGGEHVLVAEYRTSVRAERFTSTIAGTETLVLGGFTAYVLFDENESREITRYDGPRPNTTIERRILEAEPTAEISGSVLTDSAVKGYHTVPGDRVDWVVVKEVPRSTALSVTDRVRRDLWLLVAAVLVGFVLIGVVIERGPIRSIQRLARQANAIAEGDLDADIDRGDRIDEIGEVRRAFDNTKAYVETITEQADALSERSFDDEALDADIPGRVGDSMASMRRDLRQFITRLEVFNRVLRHNLRNQLDVINSHAETAADPEHRAAILKATETLAAVGTRARRIDHLISKELRPTPVRIAERVRAVRDGIEAEAESGAGPESETGVDGVTVETSIPENATVRTDAEVLTTVLRSPLENAYAYADATVTVTATVTEDGCVVEICDDGPGIPEAELASLNAEEETPLRHSRGLGLWELKWGVEALGGDLDFETDDGTTVVIRLPDLEAA